MEVLKVTGNRKLIGRVKVDGAKNSVVAILPACLLVDGEIHLTNVPNIKDVEYILEIFDYLDISYTRRENEIIVYSKYINNTELLIDVISKFRASYYFMGVLIGRYNNVTSLYPGGCNFGERPIDLHLNGFEKLGCNIDINNNIIKIKTNDLNGSVITLEKPSVGATINLMLAATKAKGGTLIDNVVMDPEIEDVVRFLSELGFKIHTRKNSIYVFGFEPEPDLKVVYEIIPDRIEASSYMILGALNGSLTIENVVVEHLDELIKLLRNIGAKVVVKGNSVYVQRSKIKSTDVVVKEYPGIPTDIQQMLVTLLSFSDGVSFIRDNIYKERHKQCNELNKMGAEIVYSSGLISILGVNELEATNIVGSDLRGTMALVIAALNTRGTTIISNYETVNRGYSNLLSKLNNIGATVNIEEYKLQEAV